jgi:hypothetical protein
MVPEGGTAVNQAKKNLDGRHSAPAMAGANLHEVGRSRPLP